MYYCQFCGNPYPNDEAVICVKCHAPKGKGINFCHGCGAKLPVAAETVCMNCGVYNMEVEGTGRKSSRSKVTAALLAFFLGGVGAHNFYLGYSAKGTIQLLMFLFGCVLLCIGVGGIIILGLEIWVFVEFIMILTGSISQDADGDVLS